MSILRVLDSVRYIIQSKQKFIKEDEPRQKEESNLRQITDTTNAELECIQSSWHGTNLQAAKSFYQLERIVCKKWFYELFFI